MADGSAYTRVQKTDGGGENNLAAVRYGLFDGFFSVCPGLKPVINMDGDPLAHLVRQIQAAQIVRVSPPGGIDRAIIYKSYL